MLPALMGLLALIVFTRVLNWSPTHLLVEVLRSLSRRLGIPAMRNFEQPIVPKIKVVEQLVSLRQGEDVSEGHVLGFIEPIRGVSRLTKGNLPISPIASRVKGMQVIVIKFEQSQNHVMQFIERGVFSHLDSCRP